MVHSNEISEDFPYQSHFVEVMGSKMHYIDEGEGDVVVFVHGIPTSCYLWRNIIPELSQSHRCIALDLIGMGKSDKPDIDYTVFEHIEYFTAFLNALELKQVTLVLHAWGSIIGFSYFHSHPNQVKALAFLESYIRPASSREMISLPIQELAALRNLPDAGYDVVMRSNYFVNKVLPSGVLRKLTDTEMQHYREPFEGAGACRPLWQYLQDLPSTAEQTSISELIETYSKTLQESQIPKLLMYAIPGFNTTVSTIEWARDHLPNITLYDIGDGLHYPQESSPWKISSQLSMWLSALNG